ncbi:hypothetical protein G5V59_12535 [Nocardioides sp. W3-2-3]|uniref:hypothetical protein n=1 Tax=Nocardioides convexus TaxID=2712224 RepID=UPI0024186169|nr:hypothetical protein [Nocardioides convexus]NHA00570.1 hypothetical protein [Nocardioides convexus]
MARRPCCSPVATTSPTPARWPRFRRRRLDNTATATWADQSVGGAQARGREHGLPVQRRVLHRGPGRRLRGGDRQRGGCARHRVRGRRQPDGVPLRPDLPVRHPRLRRAPEHRDGHRGRQRYDERGQRRRDGLQGPAGHRCPHDRLLVQQERPGRDQGRGGAGRRVRLGRLPAHLRAVQGPGGQREPAPPWRRTSRG